MSRRVSSARPVYFWLGCAGIFIGVLALQGGLRDYALRLPDGFTWQVVSGSALLLAMMFQWYLLVVRQFGTASNARWHYLAHRWVGVLATLLFSLHALRFGYGWISVLTVVFILTALSGLLNKEVVRYKSRWAYMLWLWLHIALSTAMVPLIAIHIWVALAYQGGG